MPAELRKPLLRLQAQLLEPDARTNLRERATRLEIYCRRRYLRRRTKEWPHERRKLKLHARRCGIQEFRTATQRLVKSTC